MIERHDYNTAFTNDETVAMKCFFLLSRWIIEVNKLPIEQL